VNDAEVVKRDVRELWATRAIAHRPDVLARSQQPVVHSDKAMLVELDAGQPAPVASAISFRVSPIFVPRYGVFAQAVAAQVAFRDREGDLLPDLGIESSTSQCGAEIEVTLQRYGRVAEHTEKVGNGAKLGLHIVEQALDLGGRAVRIMLRDAVAVLRFAHSLLLPCNGGAAVHTTRFMPNGGLPQGAQRTKIFGNSEQTPDYEGS
jgi:hypothetical protein